MARKLFIEHMPSRVGNINLLIRMLILYPCVLYLCALINIGMSVFRNAIENINVVGIELVTLVVEKRNQHIIFASIGNIPTQVRCGR